MTYTRRQLAKQAKAFSKLLVPIRRLSMEKRYEEAIRKSIVSKPEEFDKDFFKELSSRYYDLEKSFWNIQLIYILIAAFLASRLLGGAEISLFGLSIKSPTSLREPLLFALAILGVILMLQLQQLDKMRNYLKVYSDIRFPENRSLYAIKFAQFIPNDLYIPNPEQHLVMSKFGKILLIIVVFMFIFMYLAIVFISGCVGFINAYDIYQNPSQYPYISYLTVLFFAAAWLFGAAFIAVNKFPFAHRDYTEVNKLTELQKTNKEEHEKALKKLSHLAFLKAGLRSPHEDTFKDEAESPNRSGGN